MTTRLKKRWGERAHVEETQLAVWKREQGVTLADMSRMTGISKSHLPRLLNGTCVPTLVCAFRIEQITKGKVPAESWLDTMLAKQEWQVFAERMGHE